MILGRGADHRRPADVDIFDAFDEICTFLHRRFERIEIDHQKIDRCDAMRLHGAFMLGIASDREQSPMHLRMQGFDPAVHHFRKAGQVGNVCYLQPRRGNRLGGAAGGDELDAVGGEGAGKFDQSGLVGNGKQCTGDAAQLVGHGQDPLFKGVLMPRRAADIPALPDGAPSKSPVARATRSLAVLRDVDNAKLLLSRCLALHLTFTAAIRTPAGYFAGPLSLLPNCSNGQSSSGSRKPAVPPVGSRSE